MIHVDCITLKYPGGKGIEDVSFTVKEGEVMGYLVPFVIYSGRRFGQIRILKEDLHFFPVGLCGDPGGRGFGRCKFIIDLDDCSAACVKRVRI